MLLTCAICVKNYYHSLIKCEISKLNSTYDLIYLGTIVFTDYPKCFYYRNILIYIYSRTIPLLKNCLTQKLYFLASGTLLLQKR